MSERRTHIAGWILFIVSALGFIVAALDAGDLMALAGGVFFLAGCIVFLIPLCRRPDAGR